MGIENGCVGVEEKLSRIDVADSDGDLRRMTRAQATALLAVLAMSGAVACGDDDEMEPDPGFVVDNNDFNFNNDTDFNSGDDFNDNNFDPDFDGNNDGSIGCDVDRRAGQLEARVDSDIDALLDFDREGVIIGHPFIAGLGAPVRVLEDRNLAFKCVRVSDDQVNVHFTKLRFERSGDEVRVTPLEQWITFVDDGGFGRAGKVVIPRQTGFDWVGLDGLDAEFGSTFVSYDCSNASFSPQDECSLVCNGSVTGGRVEVYVEEVRNGIETGCN